MRRKAGFKLYALLGLFAAALTSAACSDDDDAPDGNAGTSGSAGKAGSSSNNAGKSSGGADAGSDSGGTKNTAGTSSAGKPSGGNSGSSSGGTTAGTANDNGGGEGGGTSLGGEGGLGGAAGMAGEPGMGGSGGEAGADSQPIVYDTLKNPGFEVGVASPKTVPTDWVNEGTADAAYYESGGAHGGTGKLSHWTQWVDSSTPPYTARTYQVLDPIPNGTYSFSLWVNRDWADEQYIFAVGHDLANPTAEETEPTIDTDGAAYAKVTLSGIVVTSGKVTIGVYSANGAGTWANFDDAEFVLEP